MFMKCHYQLFPYIFFKFNLEQIYCPKIKNIKKPMLHAKTLYRNQELLLENKVFQN